MAALQLETDLLAQVGAGQLADSAEFAKAHNVDHQAVVGLLKSLVMADMVVMEVRRGSCSLLQCLLWANQCNTDTAPAALPLCRPSSTPASRLRPPDNCMWAWQRQRCRSSMQYLLRASR